MGKKKKRGNNTRQNIAIVSCVAFDRCARQIKELTNDVDRHENLVINIGFDGKIHMLACWIGEHNLCEWQTQLPARPLQWLTNMQWNNRISTMSMEAHWHALLKFNLCGPFSVAVQLFVRWRLFYKSIWVFFSLRQGFLSAARQSNCFRCVDFWIMVADWIGYRLYGCLSCAATGNQQK